jgi:hypothetical protein
MTGPSLCELAARVERVVPAEARVKVGIEAAGHYHRPLLAPADWPVGWEVLELNPAHVTEQRRVMGRRRVKTTNRSWTWRTTRLQPPGLQAAAYTGRTGCFDARHGRET